MSKKRIVLPAAIVTAIMLSVGITYAITTISFAARAQTWATKNCTQKLSESSNTNGNNKTATLCYTYNLSEANSTSLQAMGNQKSLYLIDSKGNNLGIALSDSSFYNPTLNKIVQYDSETGNLTRSIPIWYTEPDCAGTPYELAGIYTQDLLPNGGTTYVVNPSAPVQQFAPVSDSDGIGSCIRSTGTFKFQALTPVSSLPFSTPIFLPLSLSYK